MIVGDGDNEKEHEKAAFQVTGLRVETSMLPVIS